MAHTTTLIILFSLISLCHSSDFLGYHSFRRSIQVPSVDLFIRRALLSVAIIDDYVYLEGGEVSSERDEQSTPVSVTLSIPLDTSWTNDTVEFHEIDKGQSPYLKQQGLWVDKERSMIYSWAGQGSYGNQSASDEHHPWTLKTDGNGGGSWDIGDPDNDFVFDSLYRPVRGAYTACNGVGYYLGGYGDDNTDSRFLEGQVPLEGLLTYNMTTGKWTNESSKALGYATWSGGATCIPTIGSEGLLVFMGGAKTEMPGWTNTSDPVSFSNITIYDPGSKEWYSQLSTGGPPEPRVDFCSVGVAGPNGTYEIYIYGGWNTWNSKTRSFGDVWVLSLPGFRWFKANNEAPRRAMHGCAVLGNRQMLSIGGNDNIQKGGWRDKDPWKQGIGILDLPSMTWSNEYDADASKYDSPEVVMNWYSGGGAAQWDHDEVAKLFASMATDTTESTATNNPASESTDSSSSTPVGAIAGGVVGGLALLGAIAGVWFFMRRRARRIAPGTQVRRASWAKAELPGEGSERPLVQYELDSQRPHAELPVDKATENKKPQISQRYEMQG